VRKRRVPVTIYKNGSESLQAMDSLRNEVLKLDKKLKILEKENSRLSKLSKDVAKYEFENERPRCVLVKSFDIIKKHTDAQKAQNIIDEISEFQAKHLGHVNLI
jgi:hypothetical protein